MSDFIFGMKLSETKIPPTKHTNGYENATLVHENFLCAYNIAPKDGKGND